MLTSAYYCFIFSITLAILYSWSNQQEFLTNELENRLLQDNYTLQARIMYSISKTSLFENEQFVDVSATLNQLLTYTAKCQKLIQSPNRDSDRPFFNATHAKLKNIKTKHELNIKAEVSNNDNVAPVMVRLSRGLGSIELIHSHLMSRYCIQTIEHF